jgi:hypothetical protein
MSDRTQETSLVLSTDLGSFFREIVDETLQHRTDIPDPAVKQYVLGLLEDCVHKESVIRDTVNRPLALLLHDALQAGPSERFDRLRKTGDGILLVGGLYREHLHSAGLKDPYVVAVGQRAYRAASSLLEIPKGSLLIGAERTPDILGELAARFQEVMVLLRDVADTLVAHAARTANDLARLCELWLKGRSAHVARLLRARGVLLDFQPADPRLPRAATGLTGHPRPERN